MAAKKNFTAKDMLADEDLDEFLLNPAKQRCSRKGHRRHGNLSDKAATRKR